MSDRVPAPRSPRNVAVCNRASELGGTIVAVLVSIKEADHEWPCQPRIRVGSSSRGFLLAVATGQLKSPGPLKAPNYRVMIQQDQEILRGIPEDQVTRRTELQHTIDVRIDALISAIATGRSLREEVVAYKGNWRDVVLFLCVTLFAFIWWNVPHSRTNWLLTFIVLILVAVVTAGYAMRGTIRSLRAKRRRRNRPPLPPPP